MNKCKQLLSECKPVRWLCIALVLILLSGFGASLCESSGYTVDVKDCKKTWAEMATEIKANAAANGKDVVVTFDGSNGSADMTGSAKQLCFKLLVPPNATPETPAPAIVDVHGFYNSKEMQDTYYVELAKRGYVVISLDMAGHGSSDVSFDPSANIILATDNSGMEACVEWLMSQSYVDESKIGITGHSQGGRTCGWTIQHLMRAGHEDYVKAYFGQSNSAGLTAVLGEFGRYPDTLSTGTIMCRYDEFSIVRDNSYDYMGTEQAKQLISAAYPGFSEDAVVPGQYYTAEGAVQVDIAAGETAGERAAVIYWPHIIHPWAHFSSRCSGYASEFFYTTLGIPAGAKYIDPASQTWFIKELFNLLGLIGFFLMIVPLVTLLLQAPLFRSLRKGTAAADAALPAIKDAKNAVPYWLMGVLTIVLTAAIFQPIYSGYRFGNYLFPTSANYPQTTTNTLGMWTAACGFVGLGLTLVFWAVRALLNRKNPAYRDNPFACASLDSVQTFFKAALLALTTVALLYVVVNIQYLIWGTDFRFWTFAVMGFEFIKVGTMVRYLPFFLFYYLVFGICNANGRFKDMAEWKSIALNALFNVAGIAILLAIQYYTMVNMGHQALWLLESDSVMFAIGGALGYLLLIPIFFVLIIASILSRKIYRQTGNIWLGGMINGLLFTIIICANTFTQYAYVLAA